MFQTGCCYLIFLLLLPQLHQLVDPTPIEELATDAVRMANRLLQGGALGILSPGVTCIFCLEPIAHPIDTSCKVPSVIIAVLPLRSPECVLAPIGV